MGLFRGPGGPTHVKQNLPMPLAIDEEKDGLASPESSAYVDCSDLTDVSPG